MLIIPSFKHCSNKYKLDRERLKKREQYFFGMKSDSDKRVFSFCLKIVRESAFMIEFGRSFNQPGTVNENVLESDFAPLCWHHEASLTNVTHAHSHPVVY